MSPARRAGADPGIEAAGLLALADFAARRACRNAQQDSYGEKRGAREPAPDPELLAPRLS
jgi:hypothetical protein